MILLGIKKKQDFRIILYGPYYLCNSEVDVEKELEKLKGLLDKGLIEEDDYNAKKNEPVDYKYL